MGYSFPLQKKEGIMTPSFSRSSFLSAILTLGKSDEGHSFSCFSNTLSISTTAFSSCSPSPPFQHKAIIDLDKRERESCMIPKALHLLPCGGATNKEDRRLKEVILILCFIGDVVHRMNPKFCFNSSYISIS